MNRAEIDSLIRKNIGQLALIAGVVGILPHLMGFLPSLSKTLIDILIPFLHIGSPGVYFNFGDSTLLTGYNEYTGMHYNYMSLFFYGLILYGYYDFKKESGSNSKVLLFVFSIILISQLVGLLNFTLNFIFPSNWFFYDWITILYLISSVVWSYVSFVIVKSLIGEGALLKELKTTDGVLDKTEYSTELADGAGAIRTSINERLLHHIVDTILCATLCTSGAFYLLMDISLFGGWGMSENIMLVLLMLVGRFLYYPFFEAVFGTTPGKIITGSIVVKEDGSKVRLKDALGRTFSRIVPFEPFSFLGKSGGWHDKWTETKVVKGRFEERRENTVDNWDDF